MCALGWGGGGALPFGCVTASLDRTVKVSRVRSPTGRRQTYDPRIHPQVPDERRLETAEPISSSTRQFKHVPDTLARQAPKLNSTRADKCSRQPNS